MCGIILLRSSSTGKGTGCIKLGVFLVQFLLLLLYFSVVAH
jgi:hypothetical protein